jgi:hypothetical protein
MRVPTVPGSLFPQRRKDVQVPARILPIAEGPQPGSDLSSRMADNLDKLRHAQRTINVTAISLPS